MFLIVEKDVFHDDLKDSRLSDQPLVRDNGDSPQDNHVRTLERIVGVCKKYNSNVSVVKASELAAWMSTQGLAHLDSYEVVTVGGDGTFLFVASHVCNGYIIGVNSDPARNFGNYCSAGRDDFEFKLVRHDVNRLTRIDVTINGKKVPPALNEAFFAARSAASMSDYVFMLERKNAKYVELQRSSGVIVATPSGSTGWLRNAGGQVMRLPNGRIGGTGMQYFVRDLASSKGSYILQNDIISAVDRITLTSKMTDALVAIDGNRLKFRVSLNDEIVITPTAPPLSVVV